MGILSKLGMSKSTDARPYMQRILNLTTPSLMREHENRAQSRYNRGLPIAICPWIDGKPDTEILGLGFTRDISDCGLSLLTTTKMESEEVVFTIIVDSAVSTGLWYFNATILRRFTAFGFLEYGLKINGFLNEQFRSELKPLNSILMQASSATS